ncbi:MAG: S8 family serine peptidase [bacterium]
MKKYAIITLFYALFGTIALAAGGGNQGVNLIMSTGGVGLANPYADQATMALVASPEAMLSPSIGVGMNVPLDPALIGAGISIPQIGTGMTLSLDPALIGAGISIPPIGTGMNAGILTPPIDLLSYHSLASPMTDPVNQSLAGAHTPFLQPAIALLPSQGPLNTLPMISPGGMNPLNQAATAPFLLQGGSQSVSPIPPGMNPISYTVTGMPSIMSFTSPLSSPILNTMTQKAPIMPLSSSPMGIGISSQAQNPIPVPHQMYLGASASPGTISSESYFVSPPPAPASSSSFNGAPEFQSPLQSPPPADAQVEATIQGEIIEPPIGNEFAVGSSALARSMNFQGPPHTNEALVMFHPGTSSAVIEQTHRQCGGVVMRVSPYAGFHLVSPPPAVSVEELIAAYAQMPDVLYAEPNYIRKAHLVPNDPYYIYQWHLPHLFTGWAWDIGTGVGAVVALLDSGAAYRTSGIYAQAPDLAGTLFTAGYDFVNNDAFPDDDNSHGTFMCGAIAQTTNNLLGVAGVAFNATIMLVKIMDPLGDVTIANEVDGIYFAVNNGAKIINLSLGGPGIVTTEQTAVDFAYNSGVIVIASAGNANSSIPEYPASYSSAVSVTATQWDDTRAPYSNYGTDIDVCAPGGNLALDQNLDGYADGILQQRHDGVNFTLFKYYFEEGTSPGCALVSGVAALVVGKATTVLTPLQIKGILENTAIDLGTLGWDQYYGWGKVNAYYALLNTP